MRHCRLDEDVPMAGRLSRRRAATALFLGTFLLHCLWSASAAASTPAQSGPVTHRVPRATSQITLDGTLDDADRPAVRHADGEGEDGKDLGDGERAERLPRTAPGLRLALAPCA